MRIENQVISLENAKHFHQLGFAKNSCFCYMAKDLTKNPVEYDVMLTQEAYGECSGIYYDARIPAYTFSELFHITSILFFASHVRLLAEKNNLANINSFAEMILKIADNDSLTKMEMIEKSKFLNV